MDTFSCSQVDVLMDTSQELPSSPGGVVRWAASQSTNPALQALMKEAERDKRCECHALLASGRADWTDHSIQPDHPHPSTSPCHGHTHSHPRPPPSRSRLRGVPVVTTRPMPLISLHSPAAPVLPLRPCHPVPQNLLCPGAQNPSPPCSGSPSPHLPHPQTSHLATPRGHDHHPFPP